VSVKIRLMRTGKIRTPHFRIVVSDSRKARNGLSIEEIGRYSPSSEPSLIEVNSDRAQYWLGVGAQPTEAVAAILKITGDWQKAKGLPGAEGTLKKIAPKSPKQVAYEAAVKEAQNAPADGATTLDIVPTGAVGTTFTISAYNAGKCDGSVAFSGLKQVVTVTISSSSNAGTPSAAKSLAIWELAAAGPATDDVEDPTASATDRDGHLILQVKLKDVYGAPITTAGALLAEVSWCCRFS